MERRYKLMSKLGVRNLAGYNAKILEAAKREEHIPNPFSITPDSPEPPNHSTNCTDTRPMEQSRSGCPLQSRSCSSQQPTTRRRT